MPRERTALTRLSGFREKDKIFVLAFEGNYAEPQYYEALKERLRYKNYRLHIESLVREPDDTRSAPNHVFQSLKEKKEEYNFNDSDEFWMIIDRDRWQLDEWVEKCEQEKNFFLAISNPCFELWLLLHIADLGQFSHEEMEEISRNKKTKKKRYLDKLLSKLLEEGYNKTNIKPERFLDNIDMAARQAKSLDTENILTSLGSHNYKLVSKLLR